MEEIVGELTFQARSSSDVNQASGVSVRMSIANYETLLASALRRALRQGEREAVPRISDLDALDASTSGKLELEYAGVERTESDVIRELVKRASKSVFDERVQLASLDRRSLESFDQGWKVEVSAAMASREYLAGLDEISGLREAALRLAGGDSPARLASAIEFLLEGLHLSNRLNKQARETGRALHPLVKSILYSRWDGTQQAFSLDAKQALDALSELLMEGLSAREALEWMRQFGFELAGLNLRVMGVEELQEELAARGERAATSATAWTPRRRICAAGSTRSSTASRRRCASATASSRAA